MDSYLLADADSVVAQARAGDPAALEALYRAFEVPVYNLARRICRTAEDAEDVVQETFFEVCKSIGRYREEGSLWGWVRTIAASKALMRLRRNKYRETEELQDEVMGHRREDNHLRHGSGGGVGTAFGNGPCGGLASRRRGIYPRRNRRDDGQDPEFLQVATGDVHTSVCAGGWGRRSHHDTI